MIFLFDNNDFRSVVRANYRSVHLRFYGEKSYISYKEETIRNDSYNVFQEFYQECVFTQRFYLSH